ncbi:MAG: single-stranded-DNA-specific exonuclease RecJ [Rhodospirillaceae bacterium]|nr:single-stranded-DNA-specific exonuclease RecJ [Rhodospirillaceae bacterium]
MSLDIEENYLGVESSVTGKRWVSRVKDERLAKALSQKFEIHDVLARVLAARDIGIDDANHFLNPTIRSSLPDPSHLLDMDLAIERIIKAIHDGETIGILGDYDVDGATSSSLLVRFFGHLGQSVPVYIPDRQKEGYGPNLPALLKLKEKGASLVITVDCGTTAYSVLEEAAENDIDIIVIDHHVGEPRLPNGALVINPNRADEVSPCKQLAAVGVTFLLVVGINRALRTLNWFEEGHKEPDLISLLDLVALGTICDVVPLTGVNRAIVTQGLKVMARRGNLGISALANVAEVDQKLDAYHAGFVLGPRVNAGGRVGESGLGVRLLTTNDSGEADACAVLLNNYNMERQTIEKVVQDAAVEQAAQQVEDNRPLILVAGKDWHPGVIGIVAGRLRERFNLPAFVVSLSDGLGKGSGRSIKGVTLGSAVLAANQAGILLNGGGHNMAAGFTVEESKLNELRVYLEKHVLRQLSGISIKPILAVDGVVSTTGVTADLIEILDRAGPFGSGNPRPRFVIPRAMVTFAKVVGEDHVSVTLGNADGVGKLKGIAFRSVENPIGQTLINAHGSPVHIAGNLRVNSWQNRINPQIFIDDVATI